MKVLDLTKNTILIQKLSGNRKVYLKYYGCENNFGIFLEVNPNDKSQGEPVLDQFKPIYYKCDTSIETLKMEIYYIPRQGILDILKTFFKKIMEKY